MSVLLVTVSTSEYRELRGMKSDSIWDGGCLGERGATQSRSSCTICLQSDCAIAVSMVGRGIWSTVAVWIEFDDFAVTQVSAIAFKATYRCVRHSKQIIVLISKLIHTSVTQLPRHTHPYSSPFSAVKTATLTLVGRFGLVPLGHCSRTSLAYGGCRQTNNGTAVNGLFRRKTTHTCRFAY
jgi:hypothetical protein